MKWPESGVMSRASRSGRPRTLPTCTTSRRSEPSLNEASAPRLGGRWRARLKSPSAAIGRFVVAVVLTYLGLLAVTFFIGRVIPIDPVLAIVGDRAPEHVVARVREELGLNKPLWQQFSIYLGK